MAVLGMAGGYVYGGVPASRHARERYIEKSNAAIYSSRLEATVCHRAAEAELRPIAEQFSAERKMSRIPVIDETCEMVFWLVIFYLVSIIWVVLI